MKIPTTIKRITEVDHEKAGETIKQLRKARQMPQKLLANLMGIKPPYLCDLEKGNRNWSLKHYTAALRAIAKQPPKSTR